MDERAALLSFLLSSICASVASADVAPPRPEELTCPRGAVATVPPVDPTARDPRGRPVQPWPYCAPSTCESDGDCRDGRVCSQDVIGLCVWSTQIEGGGTVRTVRERGCEPNGTCLNLESRCEQARRCVVPGAAPAAAPTAAAPDPQPASTTAAAPAQEPAASQTTSSWGCHAAARGTSSPLWLLAIVLAWRRLTGRRMAPEYE